MWAETKTLGITPCHVTVTPGWTDKPMILKRLFALTGPPCGRTARPGLPGRPRGGGQ